jgi:hypothetical protein
MNICCSGVKIILILVDNILRTKLLRQLMTFLTVQLLFDKLRHTFLMLLFCRTYLTRNFLKHTVYSNIPTFVFSLAALTYKIVCSNRHINVTLLLNAATEYAQ